MTDQSQSTADRAQQYFDAALSEFHKLADRVFCYLLPAQWLAVVAFVSVVSSGNWDGANNAPHVQPVAAVVLGGFLALLPVLLLRRKPGGLVGRLVAASAQLLFSSLFIHLTGARIEAHLHILGSLAVLTLYRDWRVFIPAGAITLVDHLCRSVLWPESELGITTDGFSRVFEPTGWVLLEVTLLTWWVARSRGQLLKMSLLEASLETERDSLEARVRQRTQELADAKGYLECVVDSLHARIAILDAEGTIVSVNSAWRDFEAASVVGPCGVGVNYLEHCEQADGATDTSSHEIGAAIRAVLREGEASESQVIEYPYDGFGERRWHQARITPFTGSTEASVVVAQIDVTDRVAATEASEDEATRAASLAQIITESPNEVYIINRIDLRFELVNDGAVKATGYSRDELLQMLPSDLLPNHDKASYRELVEPLAFGETAVLDFQTEHRRKDGLMYPVQVTLHLALYHSTPVYVAFVADISEIHNLESQLAQSQKLESIGQLAAGIAHEINTPMQCVSNNMEFLLGCQEKLFEIVDRLLTTLDSDARPWEERKNAVHQLLDEMRFSRISSLAPSAVTDSIEASRRVVEIVRAMKAMSHPGTRDKTETDLNEVLRNAATVSHNRWKYVSELETDLDPELPIITALPAELNQVFLNLIVNAADAITEKHGEDGKQGRIVVRTTRQDELVRVEIDDNGPGVPEEIRSRVFDPFFTTKDVGKGTGQGLAITYDIVVNKHGGTIDLLSTEGEGATFVICLPIVAPAGEEQESDKVESEELVVAPS